MKYHKEDCTIARAILEAICEDYPLSKIRELYEHVAHTQGQYFAFDGREYRVLHESEIDRIYHPEMKETIEDCYLGREFPWWIEIDWDETVQNVLDSDGYGNHFATYDHEEHYYEGYYVFRTD